MAAARPLPPPYSFRKKKTNPGPHTSGFFSPKNPANITSLYYPPFGRSDTITTLFFFPINGQRKKITSLDLKPVSSLCLAYISFLVLSLLVYLSAPAYPPYLQKKTVKKKFGVLRQQKCRTLQICEIYDAIPGWAFLWPLISNEVFLS